MRNDDSKHKPRVSIGMPIFNCEKTLATAIRSILNQTYSDWQLLLMEDGSSDRSLEVVRSFNDPRISVFADSLHKGLVYRLNQAVAASRGEYFARLDADDVAYPERLERQTAYLDQHSDIDLLGSGMLVFRDDGSAIGIRRAPETHEKICRQPWGGFHLGHPTWMGRTTWFRGHPYDSQAVRAEDQVLLLRTYSTSRFACLPEILCGYREDKLVVSKILRARYNFTTAVYQEFRKQGNYFLALRGIVQQSIKGLVDSFAIATGLNYRILRHRAIFLDGFDQRRWEEVWAQASRAGVVTISNNGSPTLVTPV
jgi:glycosyltransferase involved in cell wall biosynthesis